MLCSTSLARGGDYADDFGSGCRHRVGDLDFRLRTTADRGPGGCRRDGGHDSELDSVLRQRIGPGLRPGLHSGERWPRFEAKTYVAAVDYQTPAMRVEIVRAQGEHPPRGGGGQP